MISEPLIRQCGASRVFGGKQTRGGEHGSSNKGHSCDGLGSMKAAVKYVAIGIALLVCYTMIFPRYPEILAVWGIIFTIWFVRERWKGPPPVGWHTEDGGKTWQP